MFRWLREQVEFRRSTWWIFPPASPWSIKRLPWVLFPLKPGPDALLLWADWDSCFVTPIQVPRRPRRYFPNYVVEGKNVWAFTPIEMKTGDTISLMFPYVHVGGKL